MAFYFTLAGVDGLKKDLKDYSSRLTEAVDAIIEDTAQSIATEASIRAANQAARTGDDTLGQIGRDITATPGPEPLTWDVAAKHPLSAYYEFGTGVYVFEGETWVDDELREYAWYFYINGLGTLPPAPFLFNTFYEERPVLLDKIKDAIDKL